MPQSLAQLYTHVVFSTKDREPLLRDATLQGKTHAYLAGACRNLNAPPIRVGGVEDHVHLLVRASKTQPIAEFVREFKRESSKWLKEQGVVRFYWQSGYGGMPFTFS